uniref:Uncharacterized protein n=1 Tax=viral metagenome TaxID=1070528 RepID=A0A6C0I8T8_9ZZZZ
MLKNYLVGIILTFCLIMVIQYKENFDCEYSGRIPGNLVQEPDPLKIALAKRFVTPEGEQELIEKYINEKNI